MRPIFHHSEERIEAHIFVAFLAYCLQVTLKANLRPLAGGITPREVIANVPVTGHFPDSGSITDGPPSDPFEFKTMQMVDVCLPTTDGRELVLPRYTQPEPEHRVLLQRLQLRLPEQPPPKITPAQARQHAPATLVV